MTAGRSGGGRDREPVLTEPRYPRDLAGGGPHPPSANWPGGAAVAVSFVVNYEEGGERCLLHGDEESEAFLSEVTAAVPWRGMRHWNMESMYDYGARAGFWRLHRLFSERGLRPTVFAVAAALARAPEPVEAMKAEGWEIASHGLRWIDYAGWRREDERAHLREAIRLHREVVGERPRGLYIGRCSEHTLDLATEEGGFDWLSDAYDDDRPHWRRHDGRDQLVIPYSLDANDSRFISSQGFSQGEDFLAYLRDAFDQLVEESREGRPAMMSVGLHCRLVGRPGRARALGRFLDHVRASGEAWVATRGEIAAHWAERHPPERRERPSEIDRETFLARFGGVYEHSPWVAERAFALELGPAHDRAAGLANALARAFRSASEAERLQVLRAHPDLAGKLAQARRLTAESNAEQAAAGLDALTAAERARFAELNDAYTAKFGFPFIVAARDHDKAGILAAFERRLGQDRETEFAEAGRQVERIARLRLSALLPGEDA